MNMLTGTLRSANGKAMVELEGGLKLAVPDGVRADDGRKVIYGVRPENLDLASNGNGLPASVVVVEPTGADTQVFAKFGATDITAVFRERHGFRVGETISLAPARSHLFDAASGTTLVQ